jgi:nitroreductase
VETWDTIRARRDVRRYQDRAIADDDLDRILEAGRRAPSSRNDQPWDFVVCTDRAQLEELTHVWRYAGHVATSAATIALVSPDSDDDLIRLWVQYDLGQATMSMMLAAADLGIGSAHALVVDQPLARTILGFPDGRSCWWLLTLGYPEERPLAPVEHPNRRPFAEVVHRDRW